VGIFLKPLAHSHLGHNIAGVGISRNRVDINLHHHKALAVFSPDAMLQTIWELKISKAEINLAFVLKSLLVLWNEWVVTPPRFIHDRLCAGQSLPCLEIDCLCNVLRIAFVSTGVLCATATSACSTFPLLITPAASTPSPLPLIVSDLACLLCPEQPPIPFIVPIITY